MSEIYKMIKSVETKEKNSIYLHNQAEKKQKAKKVTEVPKAKKVKNAEYISLATKLEKQNEAIQKQKELVLTVSQQNESLTKQLCLIKKETNEQKKAYMDEIKNFRAETELLQNNDEKSILIILFKIIAILLFALVVIFIVCLKIYN